MSDPSEGSTNEKLSGVVPASEAKALSDQLDAVLRTVKRIEARLEVANKRLFYMPRELLTDIQAMNQLLSRYAPSATLPPVAGWALSPSALLALVDLIESSDAHTILECGSGTSTIWIAYALRKLGRGKVIALDHLPEYAERTQAIIDAHGLGWFAEARLAPLKDHDTPRGMFPWYGVDVSTLPAPIDILLVDGPPKSVGDHARYPALPILIDHLAPNARILCDDTDRPDEREMIKFWLAEHPDLRRTSPSNGYFQLLEFGGERAKP